MMDMNTLVSRVGRHVLFIGTETQYWTPTDFAKAARNAKAMGFDAIAPKRADGQFKWYVNAGHLQLERQAVLSEGMKYVPFHYCYGPRFGMEQIAPECAVLREMGDVCDGVMVADMEVEWNGQVKAAEEFAKQMRGASGGLILSTWADPVQQNWVEVIRAMAPVVSAWGPQQYTGWLGNQEQPQWKDLFGSAIDGKIMPEIDITNVSVNNPFQVAATAMQNKHQSFWIWEYQIAMGNPNLVRSLLAALGKPLSTPAPVVTPFPKKQLLWAKVRIMPGDTLETIAERLHLHNMWQDLYLPNQVLLDKVAQLYGHPSSNQGNLIFPGVDLVYRAV